MPLFSVSKRNKGEECASILTMAHEIQEDIMAMAADVPGAVDKDTDHVGLLKVFLNRTVAKW